MKHSVLIKCFLVLLTTGLWVSSMPPYNVAESAYVLFVPLLLWVSTSPNWKSVTVVGLCSAFFSWLLLFVWLRHVTYIGTIILSFYLAFYALAWIYFVRFMWPRLLKKRICGSNIWKPINCWSMGFLRVVALIYDLRYANGAVSIKSVATPGYPSSLCLDWCLWRFIFPYIF